MKKLLLIILGLTNTELFCIEKEQKTFAWEQLLPELKNEILKQLINTPSILPAIKNLQSLRLVNKQLYEQITTNKTTIFEILDSLLKKFPGFEVAIARALNTHLAEEWLKKVSPTATFKTIQMTPNERTMAGKFIDDENINGLKQLFESGYNPRNHLILGLFLDTYAVQQSAIPVLRLISQYDASVLSLENINKLLTIAIKQKKATSGEDLQKKELVINYLTEQLALQLGN